jgi:DNA-nicking Smr family endonuclease
MSRKGKVGGFHTPFADLAKRGAQLVPPKPEQPQKRAKPAEPSRGAGTSARERSAAKTDEEIFLEEMAGTATLDQKDSRRVGTSRPPGPAKPRRSDDADVLAELADLCDGNGTFDIADSDEYIEGLAEGCDRRLLKRLRAGEYALQGHVDLHGLTRDEAKRRVIEFVQGSRRAGRRCVLVVHGRGLHSKDQIPVLKEAVRTWLERGPVARSVLAFATARPHDGGAGAVYVLLRR